MDIKNLLKKFEKEYEKYARSFSNSDKYVYDSNEQDGPIFVWKDITGNLPDEIYEDPEEWEELVMPIIKRIELKVFGEIFEDYIKDIIEIQEEIEIEQEDQKIILEKGDKIRILESTEVTLKEYKFKRTRKIEYVVFEYLFDNPEGDNFWIKENYDLKEDKFDTFKKFEDFDLYTIEGKPLKIWFDNRIKEDIQSAKQKVKEQQEKNWKTRADFYQKNVINAIRSGTPEFKKLEIFPDKRRFVEGYMHHSHIRVNFDGSKGFGYIQYAFEQWDDKKWNLYQRGYRFSDKYYKRLSSALNKFIKS